MKLLNWQTRLIRVVLLLQLSFILAWQGQGASLTATGMVHSLSIQLLGGTSTAGYYLYYNTPDGLNSFSRSQTNYCGELRPLNGGTANYQTDYDIYAIGYTPYDGYAPVGYGSAMFTIPSTDVDGDGLIDFLDRSKLFNSTVIGTFTEYLPLRGSRTYATTCTFNRGSGTTLGSFSFINSAGQTTGRYLLNDGKTKVTYDPAGRTISFTGNSFTYGSEFSSESNGFGTSTYEILSATSIRVNAFTFSNSYKTVSVNSFILNRTGNKYTGTGSMQDGNPFSSWVDYQDFFLSLPDTNDTDGDGIPDLSDDLIFMGPAIVTEPQSKTVIQGVSTNLTVTASSPYALSYQWYFKGSILDGQTGSSLQFDNVQSAQAGNYTVVVTSNGKTKTSQVAVLTVLIPPLVTFSPASTTILAGRTLSLTVGATGSPAPTFEWYRNDGLISGINGSNLTINSIALNQGGIYQAKAVSPAGHAHSDPIKVNVTTGIFHPTNGLSLASIESFGFPLNFELENGKSYRIEYSNDLITWMTLTNFTSTSTARQFLDTAAAVDSRRFYRLKAE